MYALIGNIGFSSKMNRARIEAPFNVKCNKVRFFIEYCNDNDLTPVFVGDVFDKNISVKNLYEVLEFFAENEYKKDILFVSEDYRVRMLARMIGAIFISPNNFNADQDCLHIANDRSHQVKPPYKVSIVSHSKAGNDVQKTSRGIIEVNLGNIYREGVDESGIKTGFLETKDGLVNERQFPLNNDCFISEEFFKDNLLLSDDFAKKLKEFDSLSIDESRINSVISDVLSDMGANDFEDRVMKELLEKSDSLQ